MKDMTKGNSMLLILQFMLPVFLGNMFQQMYNLVDTVIVGRLLGVNALAAVGATGSLMFVVIGWVMGITSGFGVKIAQSFGAQDERRLREQTAASALWCVLLTVIMTVGLCIALDPLLRLMNVPEEIFADTRAYLFVIFLGVGISFLYNMLASISRALGDSKTPLYFLILSSLMNIVLDYVLIAVIPLGVAGAAYATVISQAVSGVLCFVYVKRKYQILQIRRDDWSGAKRHLWQLMRIGAPMGLQFSITGLGTMVVQAALNTLGAIYIAGFSAAIKVQNTVTQICPALGMSLATYTGQNHGAGRMDRVREGVRDGMILSVIIGLLCALFVYFGSDAMTRLFVSSSETQMDELLAAARTMFHICMWFYIPLSLIFVFRNVLQGLGNGMVPMLGGIFELFARGAGTLILAPRFGYPGICFTDPLAWIMALIPLIPYYVIVIRKYMKKYEEAQAANA